MKKCYYYFTSMFKWLMILTIGGMFSQGLVFAQGVTTAEMSGTITDRGDGQGLVGANVVAVHEPTGTRYGTATRDGGLYDIPNMRVGGPYTVTVTYVGYKEQSQSDVYLRLGQDSDIDFQLAAEAIAGQEVTVIGEMDDVLNSGRTGAATYVNEAQVTELPSIRRSTRDLTRLDPRSDSNYSFGGKNWLYNNVSLDGSYFSNPFGLDDPAPGGQAGAEAVPFDAVEQVQISVAPFDVREGGFTGAGVNTVTKSGTNQIKASLYTYTRNEDLQGNTIRGNTVIANPSLAFNQSGFTASGPIIRDKLFFFVNGEIVRRDNPGTDFVARTHSGAPAFGESRVEASVMDQIRARMMSSYGFETGEYDNYLHGVDSDKLLVKMDWNINNSHNLTFRWNRLDSFRDQGPHPFVLSFNDTGRGPNENSLPFQNAGYRINNRLNSFALELNSRASTFSNKFFASYNRFRDFRNPFSSSFPTVEIAEDGVTYTTAGEEPFSNHNILDQDVLQITNNLSFFKGNHVITVGANFEYFSFFNSFNIFRNGFFPAVSSFSSLDDFFDRTDPNSPNFVDLRQFIGSGPFKGEDIKVGQLGFYAQDEMEVSSKFNLTYGLRADFPIYFTDPVDNPFSRALNLLDADGNPETIDQSKLPGSAPLWSPRVGFNWDVTGNRSTQVRGGTGIFTGRVPFVWIGNVISNPGPNPNLFPSAPPVSTSDDAVLQQSFDLNGMVEDFKWPQAWTTNFAVDKELGGGWLGTLEFIYSKDINSVFVRDANLAAPSRTLEDGRPYHRDASGNNRLNTFVPVDGDTIAFFGGAYVLDNSSEGWNYNLTAQVRKFFASGFYTSLGYTYLQARNKFRSTEIASVLWQSSPVGGNPNNPELSFSEFGNRHRFVGTGNYKKHWSESLATSLGLFLQVAEGNQHTAAGGNRYSFIYSGDVNGDAAGGNDLIFIPSSRDQVRFDPYVNPAGVTVSPDQQWSQLDAFIEQDSYLKNNRGKIAERFGLINKWYWNLDLRLLQDFNLYSGSTKHTFQLSLDILNFGNLLSSNWGVRQVANTAATSPLTLVRFDGDGEPVFNFTGPSETFTDNIDEFSRWQIQVGIRYLFN